MDCSTPGFPIHHELPELTQTHVHRVSDAIQPSQPLSSPFPPTFNLSQHQGLFQWVSLHIRWPKNWRFSFSISPSNAHSGLISIRIDWVSLQSKGLSNIFSSTTVQKHQFFSAQPSLWSDFHICTWDWKNHSFNYMDFCQQRDVSFFYMLSRLVIAFLPRSTCFLISWLQSPYAVILEPKKIKSVTVSIFSSYLS